jgi:TolB-like protein/Flp pilus assembly protein TadD
VAETSRAVFLSYASQDAEVARKICDSLRTAGIEVWFDQSELRGGDVWDQRIRREIQDCALFLPVISTSTVSRHEGYFRLEWDLADQRTHMIARNRAFIVPVCVDGTPESSADTPESFRRVQWTRLPAGDTPPAFVERVSRLLSPERSPAPNGASSAARAVADHAAPRRGILRRRMGVLYGAIAAAVILCLGYPWIERAIGPAPRAPSVPSIAVLPLTNESGQASQQYFSDGISEDLITALSQFPGLKVIGRTSAFQFRDSKEDSRTIGAKLGVAHLLEGSIRRAGNMVRVSAELIDTSDGSTQWSARYDRPYKDLFALQDEITQAVAGALRAKLLAGGVQAAVQSERPPSGNLEAYDAMMLGLFYDRRQAEADKRKAIEYYTRATQLDPRYSLAWAALSAAWNVLSVGYLHGAAAQEGYAKAREAAYRSLALSPDLPNAHVARGLVLHNIDFDWNGADAEFRRALALSPNSPLTKFIYGYQLATLGRLEPAVELTRQALSTEPLEREWYFWLAVYLSGLNRPDEAERAIRRSIELQPAVGDYLVITIIDIQRGEAQAALAAARQEPAGPNQDLALALARQIGSDRSAADTALRTLINKQANDGPFAIAGVYALRNDAPNTFKWLDRAWTNRDPDVAGLLYDPFILRYRNDPRFAAFCRKIGLPVPGQVAVSR